MQSELNGSGASETRIMEVPHFKFF